MTVHESDVESFAGWPIAISCVIVVVVILVITIVTWWVLSASEANGTCYLSTLLGPMSGCGIDVDACTNDLGTLWSYVCASA